MRRHFHNLSHSLARQACQFPPQVPSFRHALLTESPTDGGLRCFSCRFSLSLLRLYGLVGVRGSLNRDRLVRCGGRGCFAFGLNALRYQQQEQHQQEQHHLRWVWGGGGGFSADRAVDDMLLITSAYPRRALWCSLFLSTCAVTHKSLIYFLKSSLTHFCLCRTTASVVFGSHARTGYMVCEVSFECLLIVRTRHLRRESARRLSPHEQPARCVP